MQRSEEDSKRIEAENCVQDQALIHSTADSAQSLLTVTGELYGSRVTDLNVSNSTYKGRNRVSSLIAAVAQTPICIRYST